MFEIENGTLLRYDGDDKEIIIPDKVMKIAHDAFSGCMKIESVYLHDNVTSVGSWAFASCSNLKYIRIPEGLVYIGEYVFSGCRSLKNYEDRFFKATDGDMICKGFQYEIGKTYEMDNAVYRESGFHACSSPLQIFNYYNGLIDYDVRIFEVKLEDIVGRNKSGSRVVGKKITFLNELNISELAEIASDG